MLLLNLLDGHLKHLGRTSTVPIASATTTHGLHHPQVLDLSTKLVVQVSDASLDFFDFLPVFFSVGGLLGLFLLRGSTASSRWTGLK